MNAHTVKPGDTLESIAIAVYGTAEEVALIKSANPGALEALVPGDVLNVPELPGLLGLSGLPVQADTSDEVTIRQDGRVFRFFTSMALTRSMDSFDRLTMGAPFQPDNAAFRSAYTPMTFRRTELFVGGVRQYTGLNISAPPRVAVNGRTVSANGYALAGVLHDSNMPSSSFPLEFDDMDLRGISRALCKPFGLSPVFSSDPGPIFSPRVALAPTTRVLQFMAKLSQQRNLVITNDEFGQPLFHRTAPGFPVQSLLEGSPPVVSIEAAFNAQAYYSHVTALSPSTLGIDGGQHTVKNPFLPGVLRSLVFDAGDTFGGDAKAAADAKMGRMFANSIVYRVKLAGWRNARGDLWAPNMRVRLTAPGVMIDNPFEFLVRNVVLSRSGTHYETALTLILPGAFEGVLPEALPWQ